MTEVFVELRPCAEGCCAKAAIEGALNGLPRTLVGVLHSRDEAAAQAKGWALGWLRRMRGSVMALPYGRQERG